MSSIIRTTAQIANRVKYFIGFLPTTYFEPIQGSTFNSIMTVSAFTAATTQDEGSLESPYIYKDMGAEVVTIDSMSRYVARYRLVQRVNGALTEGVPNDYVHDTYYIRVWAADPVANPVTVARLG
jgi:hypothetical protein